VNAAAERLVRDIMNKVEEAAVQDFVPVK